MCIAEIILGGVRELSHTNKLQQQHTTTLHLFTNHIFVNINNYSFHITFIINYILNLNLYHKYQYYSDSDESLLRKLLLISRKVEGCTAFLKINYYVKKYYKYYFAKRINYINNNQDVR